MTTTPQRTSARERILDVALNVIRAKGYNATTVDDLCAAAKVTKGAFFHHFASKEQLAVEAADHWSALTGALFEAAPYHAGASARERVQGYLDFRAAILQGRIAEYTCLVGTMVQECTSPARPSAMPARAASPATRPRWKPTSPRRSLRAAAAPASMRAAWPCTRRPCCRALSSLPRPLRTSQPRPRRSATCAPISSSCSTDRVASGESHPHHRKEKS